MSFWKKEKKPVDRGPHRYKIGDTVVLKSGGPRMTVEFVGWGWHGDGSIEQVTCAYFRHNGKMRMCYEPADDVVPSESPAVPAVPAT